MKSEIVIVMLGLAILLGACSGPAAAIAAQPSPTPGVITTSYPDALPISAQLAVGTIQLAKNGALTKDDAAALLFLWKGMRTLSAATNPTQAELDALVNQIQEAMTDAQLQAIAAMQITQPEAQKTIQELGLNTTRSAAAGAQGTNGTGSAGTNRQNNGGFQGGGFPGGDFGPGGMGGAPGGVPGAGTGESTTGSNRSQGSVPSSAQATIQARTAQRSQAANTLYYAAVVTYLEQLTAK